MDLKVGQKAPDFTLFDQYNKKHSLSENKGDWILIYFYPKDNTPGCTTEACAIRDDFPEFAKLGIKIFGISKDSVESHEKFAKKLNLPFTLLSDNEIKVMKKYGVWCLKKMMGREYFGTIRTSFLIDPEGKIAKIYSKVKPATHAKEVLADLQILMN